MIDIICFNIGYFIFVGAALFGLGVTLSAGYAGGRGVIPGLILMGNAVVLILVSVSRYLHPDQQGHLAALAVVLIGVCAGVLWAMLCVVQETSTQSEDNDKTNEGEGGNVVEP